MENNDLIFGLQINKKQKQEKNDRLTSFAPPPNNEGALYIPHLGGLDSLTHSHALSLDAGVSSEAELIEKYRTIALYPECDMAIEEIANEAIVMNEVQDAISLDFDAIETSELPEKAQQAIRDEFDEVLRLLNFNRRGYELFRRWYIDSRIAFHKIVDPKRVKEGIKELRQLDPRKLKRVRVVNVNRDEDNFGRVDVVNEYYVYLNKATTYNKTFSNYLFGDAVYTNSMSAPNGSDMVKISVDAIAFAHSGQIDPTTGIIYGYLQKAIKRFNQLRLLEDSLVVYRLARAPERRIFYINTGTMSPPQAASYVKQIQNRYRNKIVYNADTGEITDSRRVLSMQEDYWLPRMEGNKGTEIDSLPGGQNLGDIADVEYFKDQLWNTLNVPTSRFKGEGVKALLGGGTEITREEIKFSKFIARLRIQFSSFIHDILKTQCILKQIVTEEEWNLFEERIKYDFASDSHFEEAKNAEILANRLALLGDIESQIGVFYSREWVRKNILQMSDEECLEMDKQIAKEIKENPELDPSLGISTMDDGPGLTPPDNPFRKGRNPTPKASAKKSSK